MENKPICKINQNGTKWWFLNGKYHREDGPAIEYEDGRQHWFINNTRHRLDGPAYIKNDNTKEWYINGHHVTDIITKWAEENDIDLENLTEVDKALIKLIWSDYGK